MVHPKTIQLNSTSDKSASKPLVLFLPNPDSKTEGVWASNDSAFVEKHVACRRLVRSRQQSQNKTNWKTGIRCPIQSEHHAIADWFNIEILHRSLGRRLCAAKPNPYKRNGRIKRKIAFAITTEITGSKNCLVKVVELNRCRTTHISALFQLSPNIDWCPSRSSQ